MKLAIMIDESSGGNRQGGLRLTSGGTAKPAQAAPTVGQRPLTAPAKSTFKRMTDTELADKKAKGLCFRCDGKFGPGHRCPDKTLKVMVIMEGEESEEEEENLDEHVHLDTVEVSAQSVGIMPRTMKLRGLICGIEVVVLVDSGATNNFISVKLVEPMGLTVSGTRETGVILGNGKHEKSVGICKEVKLQLPGILITDDFYPLELGSMDVILGIKWLRRLGDTRVNWRTLSMTFEHEGRRVTLKGTHGCTGGQPRCAH